MTDVQTNANPESPEAVSGSGPQYGGKVDGIPGAVKRSYWREQFETVWKQTPGETHRYFNITPTHASNLKADYGVVAATRDTHEVNGVDKATLYVMYPGEAESAKIKADIAKRRAEKASVKANGGKTQGTASKSAK